MDDECLSVGDFRCFFPQCTQLELKTQQLWQLHIETVHQTKSQAWMAPISTTASPQTGRNPDQPIGFLANDLCPITTPRRSRKALAEIVNPKPQKCRRSERHAASQALLKTPSISHVDDPLAYSSDEALNLFFDENDHFQFTKINKKLQELTRWHVSSLKRARFNAQRFCPHKNGRPQTVPSDEKLKFKEHAVALALTPRVAKQEYRLLASNIMTKQQRTTADGTARTTICENTTYRDFKAVGITQRVDNTSQTEVRDQHVSCIRAAVRIFFLFAVCNYPFVYSQQLMFFRHCTNYMEHLSKKILAPVLSSMTPNPRMSLQLN